ncbi:MAG: Nif3-like dinuclear metal center hexameric protein [Deltaproteobacteria bacterium]|nr:Nif3-like dinuclear metal center hexameric protein [Deltaproteobacteria bacterium]
MPVHLREIVGFLDETLEAAKFRDYAPNGLQVEGTAEVERVVTGVSASAELIGRAVELGADLIVVHHGLVWGGGIAKITGPMRLRLKLLLGNDVSLAAYHLPLDKHARLGNNAGIADALGLEQRTAFGDVKGVALGLAGTVAPMSKGDAIAHIARGVCAGAPPRFVFPYGPDAVKKIGICSGAASDLLEAAAQAGCDLFLTGELAERAGDLAKELGITLVAAGHVATEVFGPIRLADELRARFSVDAQFVHVPSPL